MEEFELEPDEKIICSVRSHIIILFLELLPYVLLAFVPLIVPVLLHAPLVGTPIEALFKNTIVDTAHITQVLTALYLLCIWIAVFSTITRFYLTVWILTTLRIVDIEQSGFFERKVSSFLLSRVQDITTNINGALATLVGFGTLEVETAGHNEKFVMSGIVNPDEVRDIIMREVALLHAHTPEVNPV
jgi:Bacterial PH domain